MKHPARTGQFWPQKMAEATCGKTATGFVSENLRFSPCLVERGHERVARQEVKMARQPRQQRDGPRGIFLRISKPPIAAWMISQPLGQTKIQKGSL